MNACDVITSSDFTRFVPQSPRAGKRGVILLPGINLPAQFTTPATYHSVVLATRIANEGIPCITGSLGGNHWANDSSVTAIASAFTALVAMGAASDKFVGIGSSLGHAGLLRYAIDNPTKVAAGVGIMPLCDVNSVYVNDTASGRAGIQTAWGITYPTALPARGDLATTAAGITGKPWKLAYSTADTSILPATVTAMATTLGCTATVVSSSLNHGDALMGAYVDAAIPEGAASSLIAFLIANGC